MARSRHPRKPTFIWQPLLILFPVGILAVLGFLSLRQDKIIAQHEAVERAQTIADLLVPRLWSALTNGGAPEAFESHAFQIDNIGELLFPPPLAATPSPDPLNLAELSPEQAALWQHAQAAELSNDIPSANQGIRDFLSAMPPERFAAVGNYNLGSLLAKQGEFQAAADVCLAVLDKHANENSDAGLPLALLAEFKLLEISAIMTNPRPAKVLISPDDFCRAIIFDPSPMTSSFLSWISAHAEALGFKDGNEYWNNVWRQHEESRQLYQRAHSKLINKAQNRGATETGSSPEIFWFINDGENFLAIPYHKALETNRWFFCRSEPDISRSLYSLLETNPTVPDYFGIAIEVAGKQLPRAAVDLRLWRKAGSFERGAKGPKVYSQNRATNVLAAVSHSENGTEPLKIEVYLTSPATLFQRQSDRTFWFGSLVAASAVAAFIGLFSAWRAFNRQQQLADMKSNFVSSVSHELRAPIASVRLMAESLERGKVADPPKQHEYFRFIGQECRRLSSLIENVLDFSRIDQGRKQYEFEPTDLLALVQQTVKLIEPYAIERQISLSLKLPDHQSSTSNFQRSLDGRAIQQALINLLDNAIKHSPNGQTVSVILDSIESVPAGHSSHITHHESPNPHHESNRPASRIRLSVTDHGPGIPAEEHEKIFERFYRLGSELRRETQGVGIGLSIVKHIVEAHRGRVIVESAPGKGSRFTIELPLTNEAKSSEV
jgi:signal transduction histidine kinase